MAKAKMPEELTAAEKVEMERRATHLLKLHGVKDTRAHALWRRHSTVYQSYPLMIASDEYKLRVMFSHPADERGLQTYQMAFEKMKVEGRIAAPKFRGSLALELMRRIMLLEDLADV